MSTTLTLTQIAQMLPRRQPDAQKGDFGRLLCITGSSHMPGACLLSTHAALRTGAGLVTVFTAPENPMRLAAALPETMWRAGATDADGFLLNQENHDALLPLLQRADGVLIGCGMGLTENTRALTHWVLEQAHCPVVVDADGLNAIAGCIHMEKWTNAAPIFTPHPGEMARLTGKTIPEIQGDRLAAASRFTAQYPVTLVLKGAGTLVAQDSRICRNPTGNPGMSRGGSGDVLAGMIAALVAQGRPNWEAACIGVYLHGLAGDLAAAKLSQEAMLPSDLVAHLPKAFLALEQAREN